MWTCEHIGNNINTSFDDHRKKEKNRNQNCGKEQGHSPCEGSTNRRAKEGKTL